MMNEPFERLINGDSYEQLGGFNTDNDYTTSLHVGFEKNIHRLQRIGEILDNKVQCYNLESFIWYMVQPTPNNQYHFEGIECKSIEMLRNHIKDNRLVEDSHLETLNNEWTDKILVNLKWNVAYVFHNEKGYSNFNSPIQVYNLDNCIYFVYEPLKGE